ncbi:Kynureninase like protein, partial [Aduncisulcus paluster]
MIQSADGLTLEEDRIIDAIDDQTALVLLPGVLYRSGQQLDMKRLIEAAHEKGALIGLDLSHSAGAVEHALHDWEADFAFWCNYKYFS